MKRMLTRKPFSKMTGLTLLETMFALAVGALVLIGAVIFYMSTKQSANTSKTVGDMNAIVSAYQSYLVSGADATKTPPTIAILQTGGYLPTGSGGAGVIYDAWGLAYGVEWTPATSTLTITVTGLATGDKNCAAVTLAVGNAATPGTNCSFAYKI
jgi:type II secretory pathway pseudopilin PulG